MLSGRIVIADGSFGEAASTTKKLIDAFLAKSKTQSDGNVLCHIHQPSLSLFERTRLAMEKVDTPYVFVLGDDDLLFVDSSFSSLVQFLDSHPDYSFCHGQSVWGWSNPATGNIIRCCVTEGRERFIGSFDNPILNFCGVYYGFFCHGSAIRSPDTYYGLRRTEQYRQTVEFICKNPTLSKIAEVVMFSLTCLQGKVRCLEGHVLYRDVSAPSSAPLRDPMVVTDSSPVHNPDVIGSYREILASVLRDPVQRKALGISTFPGTLEPGAIEFIAGMLAPSYTHGEGSVMINEAESGRFDDSVLRPNAGWLDSPLPDRLGVLLDQAESAGKQVTDIESYAPSLWY